jgi:hypothetical protein
MKSYYDVVGAGEGISGLLACVLLANKGFSCLWADTAPEAQTDSLGHGIPLLVTRDFWDNEIRPLLQSVDSTMPVSLRPRAVERLQAVIPGKRFDVGPGLVNGSLSAQIQQKSAAKYLQLLGKSMTRPGVLLRASSRPMPAAEPWQREQVGALCRTGKPGYLSYLRWMASLSGMYAMDYTLVKEVMASYLKHNRGESVRVDRAEAVRENVNAAGLSFGSTQVRSRYCLSESAPDHASAEGFVFYGSCIIDERVIPVGMGDMLVVSPPEDMRYPLVLLLDRGEGTAVLSVTTKVPVEGMLASRTEVLSWASGMVYKRIREVVPYLERHLKSFEVVDPFEGDSTRPWFGYADEVKVPWYVTGKRYMKQSDRIFTCNAMQYGWLDTEGEVLWGICMANAILDDLNRSDLIAGRTTRAARV